MWRALNSLELRSPYRERITVAEEKARALQEAFAASLKRQLTGQTTRNETRDELLKTARQYLGEKDVAGLLDGFGRSFLPQEKQE